MAGDKVLDWCRTEPIPKGLKDSARGFQPRIPTKKTIRPEGVVNVGVRNQVPNIIWGTDDLPPLQGEVMILDLTEVKTPG